MRMPAGQQREGRPVTPTEPQARAVAAPTDADVLADAGAAATADGAVPRERHGATPDDEDGEYMPL